MRTMTDHLLETAPEMNGSFESGYWDAQRNDRCKFRLCSDEWAESRTQYGFVRAATPLTTPPTANSKLKKASRLAYGLTLQHHSVKLADGTRINLCPSAGHCTKVCVLDTGQGRYPMVQLARMAKTQFLHDLPHSFAYMLGFELARASKHAGERIDFRPNINSDIEWQLLLPSMLDGSLFADDLWCYGYSKHANVLETDGWLAERYRVAFSANETCMVSDLRVKGFLARGGSVAVVTNRNADPRVKQQIEQWHRKFPVVDASKDDSWVFGVGVIGDLAARGEARKLIGKSNFVQVVY